MEAACEGDNLVAPLRLAVQTRELDRGLIRLSPAVAKETNATNVASIGEDLAQKRLRLGVPGVGNMDERRNLFLDRLHHARRTVPEKVAPPTGKEIEIAVPLRVPDPRVLAANQADRVARVIRGQVFLREPNDLFTGKGVGCHVREKGERGWGIYAR